MATSSTTPLSPMHVDGKEDVDTPAQRTTAPLPPNNDTTTSSTPSSPLFSRDQRVLAQDPVTTQYYNATVRDLQYDPVEGEWKFRIHYQGWNSRWDRWLSASHIALEQQAPALKAAGLLSSSNNNGSTATPSKAASGATGEENIENEESIVNQRKRKNATSDATSTNETPKSSRKRRTARKYQALPFADSCELPITLQTVLVEEWERLTRPITTCTTAVNASSKAAPTRLVHSLPAAVTIHQVLKHFAKKQPSERHDEVSAFCRGLSQLFQVALPKCLLYPQERPQYEKLISQHHSQSSTNTSEESMPQLTEIYGCEYLLRLYVRLPFLMPSMDPSACASVSMGPFLSELLVLMQKNRQACFKGDYRRPERDEWTESEVKWTNATTADIPRNATNSLVVRDTLPTNMEEEA